MADITYQYSLNVNKGSFNQLSSRTISIDQANAGGGVPGLVTAATGGGTAISYSALTNPGVCECTNLDDTNYVDIGILRFLPGETWTFRIKPGSSLTAVANTAACRMKIQIFEA